MRIFGLIGFPLSHSFSGSYFEKKFASENITDATYRLFPLEDISALYTLIHNHPELSGFNVTIPYKVAILNFIDNLSQEAASIGAVNCVKINRTPSGISLTGHNTDTYGFRKSLLPFLKPYHQKALVLGSGGAAKAVCYSLHEMGIQYTMVSRSKKENIQFQYNELTKEVIAENLLIINTTPAGMYPNVENFPDIPYQFLNNKHLLFDLIYNPAETLFMKLGSDAGATVLNGLQMLELQAEKSWEIWNAQ